MRTVLCNMKKTKKYFFNTFKTGSSYLIALNKNKIMYCKEQIHPLSLFCYYYCKFKNVFPLKYGCVVVKLFRTFL